MARLGTVAIVGVGLIGGSIGLALRARGLASRVVGQGRDPAKLAEARVLGAIDEGETDLARAVAGADVAVVCTPVSRIAEDCLRVAEFGPDGLLITDGGSTKAAIVRAVEADARARSMFCAAHPIAGSEKQGVAAARADLFEGRVVALTPTDRTPGDRRQRASEFWRGLGAEILILPPDRHDEALAYTSHLPHAVASVLAGVVPPEWHPLAAGAYRDGTRVASADPDLWADIFLANPAHLAAAFSAFRERMGRFEEILARGDAGAMASWWREAKARRDLFSFDPARGQDPPADDPPRGRP